MKTAFEFEDKKQFIENNIGLVHSLAKRFSGKGIEYDDLFQAGCMGLIKAYNGFDQTKGFMFSTYAVPVILGEIKRLFRENGTVKVGRKLKDLSLKAQKVNMDFLKSHGRQATVCEISEIVGVEKDLMIEALCSSQPAVSLTNDEDDENSQMDIPVLCEQNKIFEKLLIEQAVAILSEFEMGIVKFRYNKNLTQAQTALLLGCTQVKVSRTEKRIVEKLRAFINDEK